MLDAETLSNDSTSGTLALYATDLVVPSDGVQMSKIVSTDEGRIFMVGDDGRLYELEYHVWRQKEYQKKTSTYSYGMKLLIATE